MEKHTHRYTIYFSMEGRLQNQAHPDLHFWRHTLAQSMSTTAETGVEEGWTEGAFVSPDVALKPLEEAIEQSRRLLSLKDDWDGEGALGYNKVTWVRATDFL